MTKHYKVTIAFLALFLSAFFSASAANTAPKVVFIGDQITHGWTSAFAANSNWINKGVPDLSYIGAGSSSGVLARFQSDVVSLHPNIVHILIGPADADVVYDSGFQYYVPYFLSNLDAMVKEARAANIKVVLGMGAQNFELEGNLETINAVISAYGAANNIPVINYGDALCACVGSITPGGTVELVGGVYFGIGSLMVTIDGPGTTVPSTAGYALMTQMAENAIATLNLTIRSGYLQDVQAPSINEGVDAPTPNVNTVGPSSVIQFTPQGLYSDGIVRPLLNTSFTGSSGTWTSSNPLVMFVNQKGLAWALSPGTANIIYTSPNGVRFSGWTMYVLQPSG
jgi:hypothetical protein